MITYDNRRTYLPALSKRLGKPTYVQARSWVRWDDGSIETNYQVGRVIQSATKDDGRRYLDVMFLEDGTLSNALIDVYAVTSIEPPDLAAVAFLFFESGDKAMTPRRLAMRVNQLLPGV